MVLWSLVLLSGAVLGWAAWVQAEMVLHGAANRDVEARAMAHSGMAVGLHPRVSRKTPLLEETLGTELGYKVKIVSEGGKLNLNWLLRGEDPRKLAILKLWLERRGVEFHEREVFLDCLLDYVDGDNAHRLNGVEDEGNYHAANRELQSVDELAEIAGSAPLVGKAGWKDDLTTYSAGPIDLTSAPIGILRFLPGLGEAQIARLLQVRQGRDGIDGTFDDPEFKNVREIQMLLGLTNAQFQELGTLISFKDPTMRVVSEGRSGTVLRRVEVVALKTGREPQIFSWRE